MQNTAMHEQKTTINSLHPCDDVPQSATTQLRPESCCYTAPAANTACTGSIPNTVYFVLHYQVWVYICTTSNLTITSNTHFQYVQIT